MHRPATHICWEQTESGDLIVLSMILFLGKPPGTLFRIMLYAATAHIGLAPAIMRSAAAWRRP